MQLTEAYDRFQELGVEVIAISMDDGATAAKTVGMHNLEFPVLYDTDGTVSRAWSVYNVLGDGLAAPATFIIDGAGRLALWKIGQNIVDRPSTGEILAAVEELVGEGTA